jgi:hypothetical protein
MSANTGAGPVVVNSDQIKSVTVERGHLAISLTDGRSIQVHVPDIEEALRQLERHGRNEGQRVGSPHVHPTL